MPRVFVLASFGMRAEANNSETSQWQSSSWRVGLVGSGQPGCPREGTRRNLVLRRTCSGHEESCTEEGSREEGARQEGARQEGPGQEEEVGRGRQPFDERLSGVRQLADSRRPFMDTSDNNEKGPSQQFVGAALSFALAERSGS